MALKIKHCKDEYKNQNRYNMLPYKYPTIEKYTFSTE
jgi:hypothetical protein